VAAGVRLSLIVSTIGREAPLKRLLDSLDRSSEAASVELIVIDQSSDRRCIELVEKRGVRGPHQMAVSGPGVSVGRNVGLKLATGDIVAFPDDDCWFAPQTLSAVLAALDADPSLDGISGRQVTADGRPSMLRWLGRAGIVTRRNFMRTTISSTLFLRTVVVDRAGPFDEGLGVGSIGILGAGEDSDLVLRLLAHGCNLAYRPEILVYQDDTRDAPTAAFIDKMLRYGSGHGHVWRRHRLPMIHLLYISARKVVGCAVNAARGRLVLAHADIAFLRGTLAGWRVSNDAVNSRPRARR